MIASLLDNVRFTPTAGGTTNWTYSAALNGYQSPSAAGAVNNVSYPYYAVSLDQTQWEIGYGAWNSTSGTLARTNIVASSAGGTTKVNFSSIPLVGIVGLQELLLQCIGGQTITGGFNFAAFNNGTASGTLTPNPLNGNYQYVTNNGAFTLAAPTSDCAIDLLITNGASAGSITFSGFTVNAVTGEPLTTTSGNKFIISIRRINGVATYIIKALQ